jgi:hypothetical protein
MKRIGLSIDQAPLAFDKMDSSAIYGSVQTINQIIILSFNHSANQSIKQTRNKNIKRNTVFNIP